MRKLVHLNQPFHWRYGVLCAALMIVASSGALADPIETVLHSFQGGPTDGADPFASLIADSAGNLYGTTINGGASGYGTVFKLLPDGTETVLHSFQGGPADGATLYAGLIADSAGNLYGTTSNGGASGYGMVFKLSPDGTETVLHSFKGSPADGAVPHAGLIADSAGNLFGTTQDGGAGAAGTVFRLSPDGTVTVLYSFQASSIDDGGHPDAGLIADSAGYLYGTTSNGGKYSKGTVFKLSPDGTETVLHSFRDKPIDGANPLAGLIADSAGNLYGTTKYGGARGYGTVFKLSPDGTERVLHSFLGEPIDGAIPLGGLIADSAGNLYSTTEIGGASNGGTVFKLSPDGKETLLYSFQNSTADGASPLAGLIADSAGNLYGTTGGGGASNQGTVFKLSLRAHR